MVKKIVIVGAGPGGYVTAIRASQLGFDVTVIEKGNLGGTCLNEGCIPSKFLLKCAQNFNKTKELDYYGIEIDEAKLNLKKLNKRKSLVIKKLSSGVKFLLDKNKVKLIEGEASFLDNTSLIVNDITINFDYAIIATGSYFKKNIDDSRIITHTQALELKEIPKDITILGANTIGVEFAYIYKSIGSKVTLLDEKSLLKDINDKDISSTVENILSKLKVTIQCGKAIDISNIDSEVILDVRDRVGNVDKLNLKNTSIDIYNSFIKVNKNFETTCKNIFAIGDVNGFDFWAHAASQQGIYVLDKIVGKSRKYPKQTSPKCIYLYPEIATVGLTEEEAKENNIEIQVSKFPLASNGMSMILKDDKGYVKVIVGNKYKEVLGAQIVGPRATDIIPIVSLSIRLEATVDEMVDMIYSHPSVVEGLKESFLGIDNMAIHM